MSWRCLNSLNADSRPGSRISRLKMNVNWKWRHWLRLEIDHPNLVHSHLSLNRTHRVLAQRPVLRFSYPVSLSLRLSPSLKGKLKLKLPRQATSRTSQRPILIRCNSHLRHHPVQVTAPFKLRSLVSTSDRTLDLTPPVFHWRKRHIRPRII